MLFWRREKTFTKITACGEANKARKVNDKISCLFPKNAILSVMVFKIVMMQDLYSL